MTDETLDEQASPDDERRDSQPLVWATPVQLFAGLPVGVTGEVRCTGCGDALGIGDRCTVYGYRPVEAWEWDRGRCFCDECAPTGIDAPTLGTTEVLVDGEVGLFVGPGRGARMSLCAVEMLGASSPREGAPP